MDIKKYILLSLKKIIFFLSITVVILVTSVTVSADTVINVQNRDMKVANTSNNSQLQKIINQSKNNNTTIYVPKGVYRFNSGSIKLHSDITFKFEPGAIFQANENQKISFVYPSYKNGYSGGIQNVHWINAYFEGKGNDNSGSFVQSMNHAQNIGFYNCTFYNSQNRYGGQDLDLEW